MTGLNQLNSPKEIVSIMTKLPYELRKKWREKTLRLMESECSVKFSDLVTFIRHESRLLTQPLFGQIKDQFSKRQGERTFERKERKILATVAQETLKGHKECEEAFKYPERKFEKLNENAKENKFDRHCSYCEKDNHDLSYCHFFKKLDYDKRLDFVKENKLCFGCLKLGHTSRGCASRLACKICSKKHPTLLHRDWIHSTERIQNKQ